MVTVLWMVMTIVMVMMVANLFDDADAGSGDQFC